MEFYMQGLTNYLFSFFQGNPPQESKIENKTTKVGKATIKNAPFLNNKPISKEWLQWKKNLKLKDPIEINFNIVIDNSKKGIYGHPKIKKYYFKVKKLFEEKNIKNVEFFTQKNNEENVYFIKFHCHEREAEQILRMTKIINHVSHRIGIDPMVSGHLDRNAKMITDDPKISELAEVYNIKLLFHSHDFESKQRELLEVEEQFISERKTTLVQIGVNLNKLPEIKKPIDLILGILDQHEGICIGEQHRDVSPKKILIDSMLAFRQKGVDTIFLEHIFYDHQQEMLDEYMETGVMSPQLKSYLKILDMGFDFNQKPIGYLKLIQAAQEVGIRVVALDTSLSYYMGSNVSLGIVNCNLRRKGMNPIAASIIELEKTSSGKFLALMGSAHIVTVQEDKEETLPGIAELVAVPALFIAEEKNMSDSFYYDVNVKNFIYGQSSLNFVAAIITCKA